MDLHPCGTGSLSENLVQFFGRATAASLASSPPWRRRLLRPNSALAFPVTTAHGRPLRWWCRTVLCRLASFMGVAKLVRWHLSPWWRSGVISLHRCGCWQRTVAAGVAWQLLVWCGTTSGDGACGIDIVRRLGLQQIAAGGSAPLDYSGVIHRRKTAQATTLACWQGGASLLRGWSNEVMSVFGWGMAVLWKL